MKTVFISLYQSYPPATGAAAVSNRTARTIHLLYGTRPMLLPNGIDVSAFDRITPADIAARGSAEVRHLFNWPGLIAPVAAACISQVEACGGAGR